MLRGISESLTTCFNLSNFQIAFLKRTALLQKMDSLEIHFLIEDVLHTMTILLFEGARLNLKILSKPIEAPTVVLAGTILLAAAMGIGRFAYTPLLPSTQEALGWNVSEAGDVASANFLGYMIGSLLASVLTQRPDRRFWLLIGMILSAITTFAGAVIVSFPAWLGIRFFAGVGSAFCLILGTAIVIEFLTSHSRPQLGALHFSGVGFGIIISVLAIEFARLAEASVFAQWGVLGIVSILLTLGSWMIFRKLPNGLEATKNGTLGISKNPTPTSPLLKKLIVAYGMFGFGYVVTATFIVAIARRLDPTSLLEPLTWIVVGLFATPSILIWQYLARRIGIFPTLRLAYGLEAIGVLLAGFASGHLAVLAGGALLGGTFVGITALGIRAARQLVDHNQDRVIGWMTASFGFGQLLGPAVAGRLAEMTQGFEAPSALAAFLLVIGIVLMWKMEHS